MICGMPLEHEPSGLTISTPPRSPVITKAIQACGLAVLLSLQPDNKADSQIYVGNAKNELRTLHFENDICDAELIIARLQRQQAQLDENGPAVTPIIAWLQQKITLTEADVLVLRKRLRFLRENTFNADEDEEKAAANVKKNADELAPFVLKEPNVSCLETAIVQANIALWMFPRINHLRTDLSKADACKKEIAERALGELTSVEQEPIDTLTQLLTKPLGCVPNANAVLTARNEFLEVERRFWHCELLKAQEKKE